MRDDGSLVETDAAVARVFPAFEVAGSTTDARGGIVLILRHREHTGFRMVVAPVFLDPSETSDDAATLFGGDGKRGDAFARGWATAHPGTIIDYVVFDPDVTGDEDLMDIAYVGSVAAVDDFSKMKWARSRYDKTSRTWKRLPFPKD
jgi:hypothetical protein